MIDQKQVIGALMNPEVYEEDPGNVELVQTHLSAVFLTRRFAYKVKKAVNFGFLDFTTLEKRRCFCEEELKLNRRLCGDMYLEVVPINKANAFKIGAPVDFGKGKYELIFVDPPYSLTREADENSALGRLLIMLTEQLHDSGFVVVRTGKRTALSEQYGSLKVTERREWGTMAVTILRHDKNDE